MRSVMYYDLMLLIFVFMFPVFFVGVPIVFDIIGYGVNMGFLGFSLIHVVIISGVIIIFLFEIFLSDSIYSMVREMYIKQIIDKEKFDSFLVLFAEFHYLFEFRKVLKDYGLKSEKELDL